jgi:hypothetical protein
MRTKRLDNAPLRIPSPPSHPFAVAVRGLVLTTALVLLGSQANAARSLCPTLPPLAEGADDLRMPESAFTQEKFDAALHALKNFPRRIIDAPDLQRTINSSETWIGYSNSLRIVEGWILKQAALHDVESGRAEGSAVKRFCNFVAAAEYAD